MSIEVGKKVKLTTQPYAPVGKVMELDGEYAVVEYKGRGYDMGLYTKRELIKNLVQVCKEEVYGDYAVSECGRKAKERDLCGMHLGHENRRAREQAEREELARQRQQQRADEEARRKNLEAKIREKGWHEFVGVADANAGLVRLRWDDLIDLVRNA